MMSLKKSVLISLICSFSCFLVSNVAFSDTKAAFDLGSGKFKLLVAEMQEDTETIIPIFSKIIPVELGVDFAASADGNLSQRVQAIALNALIELKNDAVKNGATQFAGIATAIFRKAKNGQDLLNHLSEQTGIKLQIISQEVEGSLGFKTALALSPGIDPAHILAWDSGGASFQITEMTDNGFHVFEGPVGNALVYKAFIEEVRGQPFTQSFAIGAMSLEEIQNLVQVLQNKIEAPEWLVKKLSSKNTVVVSIGDTESAFANGVRGCEANPITQELILKAFDKLAGRAEKDPSIPAIVSREPSYVLTRLALLCAVMNKFGIHEVTFKECTGNGAGILVSPELW